MSFYIVQEAPLSYFFFLFLKHENPIFFLYIRKIKKKKHINTLFVFFVCVPCGCVLLILKADLYIDVSRINKVNLTCFFSSGVRCIICNNLSMNSLRLVSSNNTYICLEDQQITIITILNSSIMKKKKKSKQ
jgi:hypothetical protein